MASEHVILDERSRDLRRTILHMMEKGGRGHLASAFSLVEILRVLYDNVLRFDAQHPDWPQRDRFILSKGHGCMALYALLAEKGFFAADHLWKFCKRGALLGGHPEHKVPGVEASTGSLGHGLSIGIGFALNARFERSDYRTFVVVGDGECNEGSIWEAALCAGKHRLDNLTVIIDYNKQQSYGPTCEIQDLEPLAAKWHSFGFAVSEVDGHDVVGLQRVLEKIPLQKGKPSAVICHTVKGKGIPSIENDLSWHHKSNVSPEVMADLLHALEVN